MDSGERVTPCLHAPYVAFDDKGADGGATGQGWQVQDGDIVPLGEEPKGKKDKRDRP